MGSRFRHLAEQLTVLRDTLLREHELEVAALQSENSRLRLEALESKSTASHNEGPTSCRRPRALPPRGAIGRAGPRPPVVPALRKDALVVGGSVDEAAAYADIELSDGESFLVLSGADEDSHRSPNLDGLVTQEVAQPTRSHSLPRTESSDQTEVFTLRADFIVDDDMVRRVKNLEDTFDVTASQNSAVAALRRSSRSELNSNAAPWEQGIARHRCIVHPQSNRRLCWDIAVLLLVFYDIVTVPLQIFELPDDPFTKATVWITNLFWTIDIGCSLLTGTYVRGMIEMRPRHIAWQYLRTWMLLDISIVVTEWADLATKGQSGTASSISVMRFFRVLRFLRLLRLHKVEAAVQEFEARVNSNYFILVMGLTKLILCVIILNHLLGCIWYGLGRSSDDGWAQAASMNNGSLPYRYLTSVHWALTQFQASMEINPVTTNERGFAVAVVLIALILFSSFLSSITNLMMQLQSLREEKTHKEQVLRGYLQENRITTQLSVRVKKYLERQGDVRLRHEQQVRVLKQLPLQLLMDLHDEARTPYVTVHPFFEELRQEHPRAARHVYHEALDERLVQAGEIIFGTGDACAAMLFVSLGHLKYNHMRRGVIKKEVSPRRRPTLDSWQLGQILKDKTAELVSKGQFMSEAVLWTSWEYCGDLTALEDSRLMVVDGAEFARVLRRYETALVDASIYGRKFVLHLNHTDVLSDIIEPPQLGALGGLRRSKSQNSLTSIVSVLSVRTAKS